MQRTDERDRDTVDVEALLEEDAGDSGGSRSRSRERGLRGRVGERLRPDLPRVFSPQGFLVALALVVGGLLAGQAALDAVGPAGATAVNTAGGLLGVVAAGFALGLVGRRRYLEVALAGGVAAGVSVVLNWLVLSILSAFAAPTVGAGAGALAAVVGHYLGRDLRDGLTRDL